MNEEMMQKFYAQIEQAYAPVRQFAGLTVDHAEKLVNFQVEAAKSYFDFGLEQARGALQVNDVKSLQTYVTKQQEVAKTFSQKVTDDVETLAGFGKDYAEAAGKLAQENVVAAQKQAAPKAAKSA